MAKVTFIDPIESVRGKISKEEGISFRTRNGKHHTYTYRPSGKRPATAAQEQARTVFGDLRKRATRELKDPVRYTYWKKQFDAQKRYVRLDCFVAARLASAEQN